MDEFEHYQRPVTFMALLAVWADRDAVYARRLLPLTDHEVESIRAGRKREVDFLPPEQRARAWASVKSWYAPDHGQGEPAVNGDLVIRIVGSVVI